MKKLLILDLIDKTPNKYIIRYCTGDINQSYGLIILPMKFYNWYTSAKVSESKSYNIKHPEEAEYTKITITKELNFKSSDYCMKIEFTNCVLYIPNSKFTKMAKLYCFQSFLDIKVYDGNNQLERHKYIFLKNYDTRSKALYYINKFAYRFASLYNKWYISDEIIYDSTYTNIELFAGDVIYEHEYIFKNKDGYGSVIYTFNIVSVEKG